MRGFVTTLFAVVGFAFLAAMFSQQTLAAGPPADRVVVMYFHRTQRCPTCLKMGGYSEEAVKTGFAEQIKDGTVEFYYVNFQDPRNAPIAQAYGVNGPTLIVVKVVGNKVVKAGNLRDIWTQVRDKEAFFKYVQSNVAAFLKPAPQTAAIPR